MLITFNSNNSLGKYRYERLCFGVKTSQNTFQRKVDETYYACRGAVGIADDISQYMGQKAILTSICMKLWKPQDKQV